MFFILLVDMERQQVVRTIPVGYAGQEEATSQAKMLAARGNLKSPNQGYTVRFIDNPKPMATMPPV